MHLPNKYIVESWSECDDYLYCVTDWLAITLSEDEYMKVLSHLEALTKLIEKYNPTTIA